MLTFTHSIGPDVRIRFSDKPDARIRAMLKANGFRWWPSSPSMPACCKAAKSSVLHRCHWLCYHRRHRHPEAEYQEILTACHTMEVEMRPIKLLEINTRTNDPAVAAFFK